MLLHGTAAPGLLAQFAPDLVYLRKRKMILSVMQTSLEYFLLAVNHFGKNGRNKRVSHIEPQIGEKQ